MKENEKPTKGKGVILNGAAKAAIRKIRKLSPDDARFTLYVSGEETPHRTTVVNHGEGSDSRFYIYYSKTGHSAPPGLPGESTYVVNDAESLADVLWTFARHPDLYSKKPGDMLDSDDVVPYDDEIADWGN